MKLALSLALSISTFLFIPSAIGAYAAWPEDNCTLDCSVNATNPAGVGTIPAGVSFSFGIVEGTTRLGKALPLCATCKENYCRADISLTWDAHNTGYCLTLSTGPAASTACTRSYFRTGVITANCGTTSTYTVTIRDANGNQVYTESIICVCDCPYGY